MLEMSSVGLYISSKLKRSHNPANKLAGVGEIEAQEMTEVVKMVHFKATHRETRE